MTYRRGVKRRQEIFRSIQKRLEAGGGGSFSPQLLSPARDVRVFPQILPRRAVSCRAPPYIPLCACSMGDQVSRRVMRSRAEKKGVYYTVLYSIVYRKLRGGRHRLLCRLAALCLIALPRRMPGIAFRGAVLLRHRPARVRLPGGAFSGGGKGRKIPFSTEKFRKNSAPRQLTEGAFFIIMLRCKVCALLPFVFLFFGFLCRTFHFFRGWQKSFFEDLEARRAKKKAEKAEKTGRRGSSCGGTVYVCICCVCGHSCGCSGGTPHIVRST